ncbi:hypothetical protein B0H14DRAFT_3143832 [Mycena olivaceomarginata]|nr:hypothetical protein B0H14DRAFT_3143832 [Mycena olivaceomarginata]
MKGIMTPCAAPPPSPRSFAHRTAQAARARARERAPRTRNKPSSSVRVEWRRHDASSRPASPPPPAARSPYLHPRMPVRAPAPVACAPTLTHPGQQPPAPEVLAVLPSVHLASFGKDETICVRRPSHTPSTHSMRAVAFPVSLHRSAATPTPVPAYPPLPMPPKLPGIGNVGVVPARIRRAHVADFRRETEVVVEGEEVDPVRGLIPFFLSSASASASASHSSSSVVEMGRERMRATKMHADDDDDDEGEGQGEDGEMTVVDDRDGEDGEELPTPDPWRSPYASPALSVDVGMVLEREGDADAVYEGAEREGEWEREREGEREREREGEQVGKERWNLLYDLRLVRREPNLMRGREGEEREGEEWAGRAGRGGMRPKPGEVAEDGVLKDRKKKNQYNVGAGRPLPGLSESGSEGGVVP